MHKKIILTISLILLSNAIFSQGLHLFLHDIKESRYSEDDDWHNYIEFTTMVNGLKLSPYHLVRLKEVSKVVDDKGNSLKQLKGSFFDKQFQYGKRQMIKLETPARQATRIKEITGSLEYFTPTRENNGIVVIPDFYERKNENLLSEFYPELTLALIERDSLLKLKESNEKAYQKQLEKLQKEADIGETVTETIEFFRKFFNSTAGWLSSDNKEDRNEIYFYLDDPKNKIYKINIHNKEGKQINTGYSSSDNDIKIYLKEKVSPDCQLEVIIENQDAIKALKFSFKDIVLP